jgi:lysophospholipase L1-like esterase/pimeloyl-ACP methyl ester carboxylesterase
MNRPFMLVTAAFCVTVAALMPAPLQAQSADKVRVACIGASITFGAGIQDREKNCYPAQMQNLLGPGYEVRNFGVNSRTMLKHGDFPYWNDKAYQAALAFNPNIVIIDLGGNDSKPQNWKYKDEFAADTRAMIESFHTLPTRPRVLVCLPMPAFKVMWGINDEVITKELSPILRQVVAETATELIDLHAPFVDKGAWFADNVHPNAAGAALMAKIVGNTISSSSAVAAFDGGKSVWHDGFVRYDYVMDEQTLAIAPFTAPEGERFGVKDPPKGQRRCIVVAPKQLAPGNPWSWRGCYWDHQPQTEVELLRRGFHIAYISANATLRPGKEWDAWYAFLTEKHGLSRKPAFIGMSRGGEYAYTWATSHPDKVSCIYADNPGGNREALARLGDLAANDVPLLHVCGSIDPILGRYSTIIENIYQQYGGRISVMIKEGYGHHPHSLRDPTPLADFIVQSVQARPAVVPDFVSSRFTRSSFYSIENSYRDFPKEGTYITCRGPYFADCYDRYAFDLPGVEGTITVIAPKTPAPGKPWVFRADFVNREAAVDLALLAKGFHIVTGPVPYNADGPSLAHWNTVYKHLTGHGFSAKPVLAGAGGAAGEAYAWAIANPDKVSCVYGENPVLRSRLAQPPLDNLGPLAQAGVPLLHVCGSLDPWLESQTRVAEKRYKELGGSITVILKEGEGHYLLASGDPRPVVEFITERAKWSQPRFAAVKP